MNTLNSKWLIFRAKRHASPPLTHSSGRAGQGLLPGRCRAGNTDKNIAGVAVVRLPERLVPYRPAVLEPCLSLPVGGHAAGDNRSTLIRSAFFIA